MQIIYWIWIVAMAFACSVWAEEIAKLKGHNSKQWLVLGLLFGPIALIARDQCNGSKKQSQHQPLLGVMALQLGDFFCPDRASKRHGNDPDPINNLHHQSSTRI